MFALQCFALGSACFALACVSKGSVGAVGGAAAVGACRVGEEGTMVEG